MKSPHCSGTCWSWNFFDQQTAVVAVYQITIYRKVPCNVRLSLLPKRHFHPFLESSIAEAVIQGTDPWIWGGPNHEPGRSAQPEWSSAAVCSGFFFLESRKRPGVAQRVPGVLDSQISWHSSHEVGEVLSLRLYTQEMFLVFIFTRGWVVPRTMVRSEGICHWKIQWRHRESIPGPPTSSAAPWSLHHPRPLLGTLKR